MGFIHDDAYFNTFLFGCLVQAIFFILFRRQIASLFDLFFLNLLYVSFGMAGLFTVYLQNGNMRIVDQLFLMGIWLIALSASMRYRINLIPASTNRRLKISVAAHDKIGFVIILAVFLGYFLQIAESGIFSMAAGLIDSRFVIQEQNKFLAYLFSAAGFMSGAFLFRLNPNLSAGRFVAYIFPFWIVQACTFSKTGMLYPIFMGTLYYTLRVRGGIIQKPRFGRQLFVLGIAAAGVIAIFSIIAKYFIETDRNVFQVLVDRLFISFDGLVYLADFNFTKEGSLSLMQWYFSPFLKVAGLFSQEYNAFNFIIATEYWKYPSDYAGNLPNNNHIGEIIATTPPYLRWIAAVVSSTIYGQLYRSSVNHIIQGGKFIIPAAFVSATPLGFLIDGQGWFSAFLSSLILMIGAWLLHWIWCTLKWMGIGTKKPASR